MRLEVGATLPSSATSGAPVTRTLSLITNSPVHSTSARNCDRLGNVAPRPQVRPSDSRNSSGSPRSTPPNAPVSSTERENSRLPTSSMWPSQSFVLESSSPTGNFSMTRGATLMASPRPCCSTLHLAPIVSGPARLPDQPRRTYGYSCVTPPTLGSPGTNVGRTSRSRRTNRHIPNNSNRSAMPMAPVKPIELTSVSPCLRSKFARNRLADHFPAGNVSAVGTNHRPVSPLNVGSAGRGVVSPSRTTSSDVTTGPDVVVVVVLLPPPCCACAAAGVAASALTRNAVDKIRTNTSASLFRLDVEKRASNLVYSPRLHSGCGNHAYGTHIGWIGWWRQSSPTTATDLPALAPCSTGLVGGPLVGGAFLMRSASTLAGDFTLLLRRHRRKATALFSNSVHSTPPRLRRDLTAWLLGLLPCSTRFASGGGYKAYATATLTARQKIADLSTI